MTCASGTDHMTVDLNIPMVLDVCDMLASEESC